MMMFIFDYLNEKTFSLTKKDSRDRVFLHELRTGLINFALLLFPVLRVELYFIHSPLYYSVERNSVIPVAPRQV
jgi:hypothetical protein